MYTPDILKALLDAKMQEVNSLAHYFNCEAHIAIFELNNLNKEFILNDGIPNVETINRYSKSYSLKRNSLLDGNTLGGTLVYQKAVEAEVICNLLKATIYE
jgi:hypothetical protein